MGRHVRMRNKTDRLSRTIMLLLALAGLAERAATASYPVRCLVLWALRRAEAVAAGFVAGLAFDTVDLSPDAETARYGFDPADALALALSLRMLAMTLQAIAMQMRMSCLHPAKPCGNGQNLYRLLQTLAASTCPQARRLDTS
jgi:hypothetical protein